MLETTGIRCAEAPAPLGTGEDTMNQTIAVIGLGNMGTQMAQRLLDAADLLRDRLLSGMAKGRQDLDWSVLALGATEDAGLSPHA